MSCSGLARHLSLVVKTRRHEPQRRLSKGMVYLALARVRSLAYRDAHTIIKELDHLNEPLHRMWYTAEEKLALACLAVAG